MILDDVFEQKNEIAQAVSEELEKVCDFFSYELYRNDVHSPN